MNEHRSEIEALREEVTGVASRLDALVSKCSQAERQSLLLARAEAYTLADELDEILRRVDSVRGSTIERTQVDGHRAA
jgi:hypothetical protein